MIMAAFAFRIPFSLGLKMTTSYSMFLRTTICAGKGILCKKGKRKRQ
jgi:hypothetical protein